MLALTANTQPAVLTASRWRRRPRAPSADCSPALVAGHSLGEYSALVVAGALRFADAVRIVRRRGEFMQEAVPVGTGRDGRAHGRSKLPAVEAVCADAAQGEVVEVANVNSRHADRDRRPSRARSSARVALAEERGGRMSVLLPVSAPFHCVAHDAGRRAARPRPRRRSRSPIPRCRSSATSTPA